MQKETKKDRIISQGKSLIWSNLIDQYLTVD